MFVKTSGKNICYQVCYLLIEEKINMLDQSFSVKNFREIYDIENRKGIYLENIFDELVEVRKITEAIKQARLSIKNAKTKAGKKAVYDVIKEYKNNKNLKLNECFLEVEKQIQSGSFRAILEKGPIVHEKQTYVFKKSLVSFCASKQTQINLSKIFKVNPASRNNILAQLRAILEDRLPKIIIRTDVSSFYEDIPHSDLLDIICSNKLLSVSSKKYIRQVIKNYSTLCGGVNKGVPRGIGVSAYLSEIYMSKLDELVKNTPNLGYYARYVDDIVLVFYPDKNMQEADCLSKIQDVFGRMNLKMNMDKTKGIFLQKDTGDKLFEFLGYKITVSISNRVPKFELSDKKTKKLKERIRKAFDMYRRTKNKRVARHCLYHRIRFLTSNTRLLNNKNNIVVGIYYSNRFITKGECLRGLDAYLNYCILKVNDVVLAKHLSIFSFEKGWTERVYHKYSANKLKQITKIWRYDENC